MNDTESILLDPLLLKSPYPKPDLGDFRHESEDGELLFLSPLAQTNIFIGATNSGKTRFMRLLLRNPESIVVVHSCPIKDLVAAVQNCLIALEKIGKHFNELNTLQRSSLRFSILNSKQNFNYTERSNLEQVADAIASEVAYRVNYQEIHVDFESSYFQDLSEIIHNYLNGVLQHEEFRKRYCHKLFEISFAAKHFDPVLGPKIPKYLFENQLYPNDGQHFNDTAKALLELRKVLQGTRISIRREVENKSIYIPTLRSTHTLTNSSDEQISCDFFKLNIARQYQLNEQLIEIFTGLDLYEKLDRDVRGRRRKDLESFETFLSSTFFNGIDVEIIPEHPDETSLRPQQSRRKKHGVIAVKLGKHGSEMPIYLLGDGIQSLIILLYSVFMASPDTWFFIDEPEIGLHPGLQRIFLDAITNHPDLIKKNHRFFLTTHSNHLLDLTIDKRNISIFTFSSRSEGEDQKHIIRSSSNDGILAMTELGVLNSSVLMANCSIWVEGVTDRLYIQKYLNEYCIKGKLPIYQEDIHYAFFEYAGSNLAHYVWATDDDADDTDIGDDGTETEGTDNADKDDIAEKIHMQFIANRVFLIADRDKGKTKKHEFWSQKVMQSKGAFNYYVTPGKEVENLLSPEVLKAIFSSVAFRPTLKDKKENPKSEIEESDFKHTEYCDPNNPDNPVNEIGLAGYLVNKWKLTEGYLQDGKSQTGTFNPTAKLKVATEAVKRITADNMGKPAHDLARQVYEFIGRHNPMVGGSHGKT